MKCTLFFEKIIHETVDVDIPVNVDAYEYGKNLLKDKQVTFDETSMTLLSLMAETPDYAGDWQVIN